MDNETLAGRLEELGALLELGDEGAQRARAYRRAAGVIRDLPVPVADLVHANRVRELRGVGPGIERRVRELVETGDLAELTALRRTTPLELIAFARSVGLSAELATRLSSVLGVRTARELKEAAAAGRLREVPGVGPQRELKIRAALEAPATERHPISLPQAREVSERIAGALGGTVAGDARRWLDAPRRLSVVVVTEHPEKARAEFAALPEIVALLDEQTGMTVDGVPVDLVVAATSEAGSALVRATGPPEHLDALGDLEPASDEESVYRRAGFPCPPPELRGGELLEQLPRLVELAQIRGDLHVHTTWSDGRASVREMALAARDRGYEYLAICDHTPAVSVVPGLDAGSLRRQGEEIAAVNEQLAPFRVLRGIECDIRRDGTLDLPDDVLAGLDWVQLSLHAGQRLARAELTARVTEAMRHPAVRCLSHPTGRLIGHRPENALDLERTIEVALETGVALEVNGLPARLDLSGEHVREAVRAGVPIVCSTDAHSTIGLGNMELAVRTARRGHATSADVLNTRPLGRVLRRPR